MPVSTAAVGRSFPPVVYAVGREKIKEYALAVGETNPLHLDLEAARAAGYARRRRAADVRRRLLGAGDRARRSSTPRSGSNFALMVHGGQEFTWGPLVVAGDEITTVASVKSIDERDGKGFYVFESVSTNQDGEHGLRRHLDQHRARRLMNQGDEIPKLQVTPDKYLTVRYAGASGDFNPIHIDEEFAKQVGLPGPDPARAVDDGAGRARPDRGRRRPGLAQAPAACSSAGWALPEHELTVTGTVRESRRRPRDRRHGGRAGRQADHPQRRGRAAHRLAPRLGRAC